MPIVWEYGLIRNDGTQYIKKIQILDKQNEQFMNFLTNFPGYESNDKGMFLTFDKIIEKGMMLDHSYFLERGHIRIFVHLNLNLKKSVESFKDVNIEELRKSFEQDITKYKTFLRWFTDVRWDGGHEASTFSSYCRFL